MLLPRIFGTRNSFSNDNKIFISNNHDYHCMASLGQLYKIPHCGYLAIIRRYSVDSMEDGLSLYSRLTN